MPVPQALAGKPSNGWRRKKEKTKAMCDRVCLGGHQENEIDRGCGSSNPGRGESHARNQRCFTKQFPTARWLDLADHMPWCVNDCVMLPCYNSLSLSLMSVVVLWPFGLPYKEANWKSEQHGSLRISAHHTYCVAKARTDTCATIARPWTGKHLQRRKCRVKHICFRGI